MKKILLISSLVLVNTFSLNAFAQKKKNLKPQVNYNITYDLGAATGNHGSRPYNEINIGLNWYLTENLNWRNAFFSRFGSGTSVTGLDTSLRYEIRGQSEDGLGYSFFAGPGYRVSTSENSALFFEAGAVFKVGGLSLGGGVKSMFYYNPGKDSNGADLPKQDTSYFLILSGGGVF